MAEAKTAHRPVRPTEKIALFLTADQIKSLTVSLGALPRATREPLLREIDQQLAAHGVLN